MSKSSLENLYSFRDYTRREFKAIGDNERNHETAEDKIVEKKKPIQKAEVKNITNKLHPIIIRPKYIIKLTGNDGEKLIAKIRKADEEADYHSREGSKTEKARSGEKYFKWSSKHHPHSLQGV